MKLRAVLLVLVAVTLVESATASLPIAGIINIGLRLILNNLKKHGNITHEETIPITVPQSINDIIVGSMTLDNLTVYGISDMKFTTQAKDIKSSADPDISKANVSLTLSFGKIGLFTGYNVDIGIIDELPIYGTGKINLALSKVKVGVNVIVSVKSDLSKKRISDLNLQLAIFDSPGYVTGFWKNDHASQFLTGIINILEKFVCMVFTYERDCINCVLGNVAEFAINTYLGFTERKLIVNCECLKDDTYKFKELLENSGNSYANGGIERVEQYLTSKEVLNIFANYYHKIVDFVMNESFL